MSILDTLRARMRSPEIAVGKVDLERALGLYHVDAPKADVPETSERPAGLLAEARKRAAASIERSSQTTPRW